jgi:hypothetical protein
MCACAHKSYSNNHLGHSTRVSLGPAPAGSHNPVMPEEITAALEAAPGAVLFDCTLGHGGYAEILARSFLPDGRVIGLDRDAQGRRCMNPIWA